MWRHQTKKPRLSVKSEVDLYLDDATEGSLIFFEFFVYLFVDRASNPLDYWKFKEKTYPVLAAMARDYLAVPATSCSSERLFSAAGNVISEKRSRLNADTLRALLCLKNWYQSGLFSINK